MYLPMLKFVKYHLSSIEGMDVMASIALVLFMLIFVYVTYYSFFVMEKNVADELAELPLTEDDQIN